MRGGKREGSGRPKVETPLVMWFLRVPPELKQRLDKLPKQLIRTELEKIAPA